MLHNSPLRTDKFEKKKHINITGRTFVNTFERTLLEVLKIFPVY